MLNVTVDLNDTYEEFGLNPAQANSITETVLDAISGGILVEWRNQAIKNLTKSRNAAANIKFNMNDFTGTISGHIIKIASTQGTAPYINLATATSVTISYEAKDY